jgi:hypothetical protein
MELLQDVIRIRRKQNVDSAGMDVFIFPIFSVLVMFAVMFMDFILIYFF